MTTTKSAKTKTSKRVEKRSRCPVCFKGWLEAGFHTDSYVHEDAGISRTVVVENMPVHVCTNCGEVFHGPEAGRLHQQAICKTFGFLTPQEIVHLRDKVLHLSQEDFARLIGVDPKTIADVERGRTVQDRPLDRLFRLLQDNPSDVGRLRKIASQNGKESTSRGRNGRVAKVR